MTKLTAAGPRRFAADALESFAQIVVIEPSVALLLLDFLLLLLLLGFPMLGPLVLLFFVLLVLLGFLGFLVPVRTLVERFDIEPLPDFSAK